MNNCPHRHLQMMFNVTLLYTNIDVENLPFVDPFPLSLMVFPQKKTMVFLNFHSQISFS